MMWHDRDLDHLTPQQAKVYERAVAFFRKHWGFSMTLFIECSELELNFDEIMADALARNSEERRLTGLNQPPTDWESRYERDRLGADPFHEMLPNNED